MRSKFAKKSREEMGDGEILKEKERRIRFDEEFFQTGRRGLVIFLGTTGFLDDASALNGLLFPFI
jgi:hypothetical protein